MTAPSKQRYSAYKELIKLAKKVMRDRNHHPAKPSSEVDPRGFKIYCSTLTCKGCGMTVEIDAEDTTMKGEAMFTQCTDPEVEVRERRRPQLEESKRKLDKLLGREAQIDIDEERAKFVARIKREKEVELSPFAAAIEAAKPSEDSLPSRTVLEILDDAKDRSPLAMELLNEIARRQREGTLGRKRDETP